MHDEIFCTNCFVCGWFVNASSIKAFLKLVFFLKWKQLVLEDDTENDAVGKVQKLENDSLGRELLTSRYSVVEPARESFCLSVCLIVLYIHFDLEFNVWRTGLRTWFSIMVIGVAELSSRTKLFASEQLNATDRCNYNHNTPPTKRVFFERTLLSESRVDERNNITAVRYYGLVQSN